MSEKVCQGELKVTRAFILTNIDNGFGEQATETYRSHLTGGIGSVTYTYSFDPAANGANYNRLTGMTYPGGRSISYYYGVTGSLNEKISRLESIREGGSTVLEGYSYLGLGTIIERSRSQPGTVLTYIGQAIGRCSSGDTNQSGCG